MKKKLLGAAAAVGAATTISIVLLTPPAEADQREVPCTEITVVDPEAPPPEFICEVVDSDDVLELKYTINSLIDDKERALSTQQQYNQGEVNQRNSRYDDLIAHATERREAAANARAEQHWQDKIDKATWDKEYHSSEEPGSPRDEASKLGPVISQLSQDINNLKQELRAIE